MYVHNLHGTSAGQFVMEVGTRNYGQIDNSTVTTDWVAMWQRYGNCSSCSDFFRSPYFRVI